MGRGVFDHFRTVLLAHTCIHDEVYDGTGLLIFQLTLLIREASSLS